MSTYQGTSPYPQGLRLDGRINRKPRRRNLEDNYTERLWCSYLGLPSRQMKIIEIKEHKILVADEDYEWLNHWKWCLDKNSYPIRSLYKKGEGKVGTLRMAREVLKRMGLNPDGFVTDHINRNVLDNRRENLRLANYTQNQQNKPKCRNNKSGFKGVSFHKMTNKYQACIGIDNKMVHLGLWPTPKEASEAYKEAAYKHFGEFACVK